MEHTLPIAVHGDESLDIASDTGIPVNDADYKTPFTFTGKLNKIMLTFDRPKLSPRGHQEARSGAAGKRPSD
jgi:hypothetical protein